MPVPFVKMHGLGNDFVILDARPRSIPLTASHIRAIANRRTGVGCDQLIVLEKPRGKADLFMAIYNPDGSRAGACGNATRCVAALEMTVHQNNAPLAIETDFAVLQVVRDAPNLFAVNMGAPLFGWQDIPLSKDADTQALDTGIAELPKAVCVNIGNPHTIFFVNDADALDIESLGRAVETSPLFPQKTNVEFAQIIDEKRIRLRVWERGAGATRACGSGACATLVAAARKGLSGRKAEIILDGGSLFIEWQEDGNVMMRGPAAFVASGEINDDLLRVK